MLTAKEKRLAKQATYFGIVWGVMRKGKPAL